MSIVFLILSAVFMVLTVASLGGGLFSMIKTPDFREKYANKLMRYRVLFQAGALLCLVLAFAVSG